MKLRRIVQNVILPSWNGYDEQESLEIDSKGFTAVASLAFDFKEFVLGTCLPTMDEMMIFG